MAPVVEGDQQDAQGADGGQYIDQLVELQVGGDHQQGGGQADQQHFAEQQLAQRRGWADLAKETGGKTQGAEHAEQDGQVEDGRLRGLPGAQPGCADAQ